MIKKSAKNILTFFTVMVILAGIFVAAAVAVYLKVLPWAVSNPKVLSYVEDISSKALGTDVRIENPILKTSLTPMLYFGVGKVNLSDKNGKVLSDKELKNKVIDNPRYYDIALPIRKRLNEEFFSTK